MDSLGFDQLASVWSTAFRTKWQLDTSDKSVDAVILPTMADENVGRELECRDADAGVEVVDPGLASWMMRLSPTTAPPSSSGRVVTASVAAVGTLAQSLAPVGALVSSAANAGQSLEVAFSAATQMAIQAGTLHLMATPSGALPVAVDSMGRIRELARVVPFGAASASALLPVLLPAAAAAVASYYQHRVLQATLDGIREVVDRIEERLRDDDWAVLEAGDDLSKLLIQGDAGWDIPDQLRLELAVARQSVERVFRSRRRFAQQLVAKIDADTFGRPDPWTEAVRKLVKRGDNWIEVSIFLQAMVVRARLTAATAFVLAADGEARASAAMTSSAVHELQTSYEPLLKSLEPLAGRRPDEKLLDRLPGSRASDEERFRFVGSLVQEMRGGIGQALAAGRDDMALIIPAHEVKVIHAVLSA